MVTSTLQGMLVPVSMYFNWTEGKKGSEKETNSEILLAQSKPDVSSLWVSIYVQLPSAEAGGRNHLA